MDRIRRQFRIVRAAARGLALASFFAIALAPHGARGEGEVKSPPRLDAEMPAQVAALGKTVEVKIKYPEAEKRWAEVVRDLIEKGLPKIAAVTGFPPPPSAIEVHFAFGTGDTGGAEAAWKSTVLCVRKTGTNGGIHAHRVVYCLARMWTDWVARPEWLRAGLAHLVTQRVLKDWPQVYDARAYRDELLTQMMKAEDGALDSFTPMPQASGPSGVPGAPPEQPNELPQAAKAFGFLYEADARLAGAVVGALRELGSGGAKSAEGASAGGDDAAKPPAPSLPVGTRDFVAAVGRQKMLPVPEYFAGWAVEAPAGGPAPKLDKTDLLDSDGDGLLNFEEEMLGTDKLNPDTDGDGVPDGEEVEDGTDPKVKDARPRVRIDGDPKEWSRLKKYTIQDDEGDAKDGIRGADIRSVKLATDKRYLYVLWECDAFGNPDVKYQLAIDAGDDGVDPGDPSAQKNVRWNYVVGFKVSSDFKCTTWLGDTHNDKDWSWAEWKKSPRLIAAAKERTAELRIPLDAMALPKKILVLCYTTAKSSSVETDTALRQVIDLDAIRN